MARQPALKPRSIGVLIFEDFQLLDAAGPIGAFEMPMRGMQPPPYSLQVIAPAAGAIRSSSGVVWMAEAMPRQPRYDTVVIAGGIGARAAMFDPKVQAFVRAAMKTARRVCSVCSGAYILAQAGVLDGKRATTHWGRTPDFQKRYPAVKLEPDCIYTHDGKVWTSAGITAGIDLALALIADDLGEEVSRRAAQELHRRAGMTVYFSRWLFSALGPWVNFAAGATRIGWRRFSLASLLGETTWVALYIGLGIVFGARLKETGATAGSVIGALAAGLVAVLLGRALWQRRRRTA
jgi:putative intracellular protease/amidase